MSINDILLDPDEAEFENPVAPGQTIIEVRDLAVGFGERLIMNGLNLNVRRGEILGVVGASGTGKSVLLRTIIGLVQQRRGTVSVFGHDMARLNAKRRRLVERRWGVLFQHGALFSSLTVKQNIQFPMREYLKLSEDLLEEMAMVKLRLVGLKPEAAERLPSELSGGMIKRVALARALALDPEIVFLDEPTSGLDPIGAADFDELIATLQKTLGLTVFMVTHDLDSLAGICDRIAALGDGKVLYEGTLDELKAQPHPWLQAYFNGPRARASQIHTPIIAPSGTERTG
jgi:phospholipid/cholesterol/gamma-HCH transport system ATP-binding protein